MAGQVCRGGAEGRLALGVVSDRSWPDYDQTEEAVLQRLLWEGWAEEEIRIFWGLYVEFLESVPRPGDAYRRALRSLRYADSLPWEGPDVFVTRLSRYLEGEIG